MFLAPAQALVVALGLALLASARDLAAQPLGQQTDERAFQEEHEKRHGFQAERVRRRRNT